MGNETIMGVGSPEYEINRWLSRNAPTQRTVVMARCQFCDAKWELGSIPNHSGKCMYEAVRLAYNNR